MAKGEVPQKKLEQTPTWAVAIVCFVMLAISILIEHIIEALGKVLYIYMLHIKLQYVMRN